MSAVALAPASADTIVGMIETGNIEGAATLFNAASKRIKEEVQSRSAVPGKDSRFKVVATAPPTGARRKSRKTKKVKKTGKRKSRAHSRRR